MKSIEGLADFLPGRFVVAPGQARDYRTLAHYHYAAGAPATWAGVWVIRYICHDDKRLCRDDSRLSHDEPRFCHDDSRLAAVGVLSWPTPSCRARQRWFGLAVSGSKTLRFVNENIRTISRIIVHPQFRGLGLSTTLVSHICRNCRTRYVEAIARMGHIHPLFIRAGMKFVNAGRLDEPAYFIFDRLGQFELPAAA